MTTACLQLQGKRLLYPFQQGTLGKLRDTVAELRAQLEPALSLLNIDVTMDILSEVRELRKEHYVWQVEEDNRKLLTWLSPLEFVIRQHSILVRRCAGTAGWFLKSPPFIAWSVACVGVLPGLWCQGQMRTGKSVLAATIIEYLKTNLLVEEAAIYVYCDGRTPRLRAFVVSWVAFSNNVLNTALRYHPWFESALSGIEMVNCLSARMISRLSYKASVIAWKRSVLW